MTTETKQGAYHNGEFVELAPSIWYTPSLPMHWVVEGSDNDLYLAPNHHGGWAARRPYLGYRQGLTRLDADIARVTVADIGAGFDIYTSVTTPWAASRYMDDSLPQVR